MPLASTMTTMTMTTNMIPRASWIGRASFEKMHIHSSTLHSSLILSFATKLLVVNSINLPHVFSLTIRLMGHIIHRLALLLLAALPFPYRSYGVLMITIGAVTSDCTVLITAIIY